MERENREQERCEQARREREPELQSRTSNLYEGEWPQRFSFYDVSGACRS